VGTPRLTWRLPIEPFAEGEPRRDCISWPEVHRLLAAIPEFRSRMAAAWLFYTGCRVGEAIAATQSDVRLVPGTGLYQWTIPNSKTHRARKVWLPETLAPYIEQSRIENSPRPHWPMLWDCQGRGFGRVEDPARPITAATLNGTLDRARDAVRLQVRVTAHVAKHTYCTNWISEHGTDEKSVDKLSRQVGTSVAVLRKTYIHVQYDDADWLNIRTFGSPRHSGLAEDGA
jgi:integrase